MWLAGAEIRENPSGLGPARWHRAGASQPFRGLLGPTHAPSLPQQFQQFLGAFTFPGAQRGQIIAERNLRCGSWNRTQFDVHVLHVNTHGVQGVAPERGQSVLEGRFRSRLGHDRSVPPQFYGVSARTAGLRRPLRPRRPTAAATSPTSSSVPDEPPASPMRHEQPDDALPPIVEDPSEPELPPLELPPKPPAPKPPAPPVAPAPPTEPKPPAPAPGLPPVAPTPPLATAPPTAGVPPAEVAPPGLVFPP